MRGFRVSADGFMQLRDPGRVRTPGRFEERIQAAPEAHAVTFLLSHSFPGHRRVVRGLLESDRRQIQRALWADSVQERMSLVDRVWRRITEPVQPPSDPSDPQLLQLLAYGDAWIYPLHLDGEVTRVIPGGGLHRKAFEEAGSGAPAILDLRTA